MMLIQTIQSCHVPGPCTVPRQRTVLIPVVFVLVFVLFKIACRCLRSRQLRRLVLFGVFVIFLQYKSNHCWSEPVSNRTGADQHQAKADEHKTRFAPRSPPPRPPQTLSQRVAVTTASAHWN